MRHITKMLFVKKQFFCLAFVLTVIYSRCCAKVHVQLYLKKGHLNDELQRNINFFKDEYKDIDLTLCSLLCLNRNPKCVGVFYHTLHQSCKLMTHQSSEMVEFDIHGGWDFWSECDPGWLYFEGHCYLRGKENLAWNEAKLQCERQSGYLVEIESIRENEWVVNTLAPAQCTLYWLACVIWTGATDQEVDGNFIWDGSRNKLTFSNWKWKEPNNYNQEEHCVAVTYPGREWVDLRCWETRSYICEKET